MSWSAPDGLDISTLATSLSNFFGPETIGSSNSWIARADAADLIPVDKGQSLLLLQVGEWNVNEADASFDTVFDGGSVGMLRNPLLPPGTMPTDIFVPNDYFLSLPVPPSPDALPSVYSPLILLE
jgi:hypothetical protein